MMPTSVCLDRSLLTNVELTKPGGVEYAIKTLNFDNVAMYLDGKEHLQINPTKTLLM